MAVEYLLHRRSIRNAEFVGGLSRYGFALGSVAIVLSLGAEYLLTQLWTRA